MPLAGVKAGRFIRASRLKSDVSGENGVSERTISPRMERKMQQLTKEVQGRSLQEKQEKRLRKRDIEESARKVEHEDDNAQGRLAGYDQLMRLSEFKRFVDSEVKKSAGRYEAFSKLQLKPVGFPPKGFEIRPPGSH